MTPPSREFVQFLQVFEADLDARFAASHLHAMNADHALTLLMQMSEHMAARYPMANAVDKAIEVYAPHLVSGATGVSPSLDALAEDLNFGQHYYLLREYLYYAFNFDGAFQWTMDDVQVDIRFLDRSIPRQFFVSHNEVVANAIEHFRDGTQRRELQERVRGTGEWDPIDDRIGELLKAEAEHKVSAYFSIIPRDSPIDLGGYSYAQFYALYRMLVAKALWHRHQAEVNGEGGALFMSEDELLAAAVADTGIAEDILRRILRDLVYDTVAVDDRLSPGYFSLMREGGTGRIWMRPTHFCIHEGVVGLLRVVAQRRSRVFLSNVSGPLGTGFVDRVAATFSAEGFQCLREVNLTQYAPELPDIDLLVISHEPTLGYVILVCELKSPLPSTWAKDHLRALNADGVSKAFIQSRRIGEFLTSEGGLCVLRHWLPKAGLPQFDHFVVVLEPLVITSHNGGMFFDAMQTPVFSYQTIERMLKACDGDMAYIQHMLHMHSDFIDQNAVTERQAVPLAQRHANYDVVDVQAIIHFPPNQWRSNGARDALVQEFLQSGMRPLDAFWSVWQGAAAAQPGVEAAAELPPGTSRRIAILFDENPERRGAYLALRKGHR